MIGFDPSDEQRLIAETVRQFAENEIRPNARATDESGQLPKQILADVHELGLVANSLPEEFGGGGERSAITGALVIEELAWGDLAIALAVLSPSLLGLPLSDQGTEEQRRSQIPLLCGPSFEPGCLALVEPRFGFDPLQPETVARREGDEYRISGQKCFVPWLEGSTPILVVAGEGAAPQAFLVPRSSAGLKATPEENMGIRGLPTVELALDDVRVPAAARLGGDRGLDLQRLLDRGRVAIAAAAVGMARASFELARDYAKEREAFGVPIATKQAIAFMLADAAIEIDGARLLCWEAAFALDQDEDATRLARLAFDKARRTAMQAADGAVQILGGHGYIRDYLPELHLRNAAGLSNFEALALV
jgi:alkylation response protein AidB-like acyl-CoA dehydrogenase